MFAEDLSAFFQTRDFAVRATFSGNGATIAGIFDSEYSEPLGHASSSSPVFVCPASSVPSAAPGQTLTLVDATAFAPIGTVYTIRPPIEADGTGLVVLHLERT